MKLLALAALPFIACTPVMAAPCAPYDNALKQLDTRHGEKPVLRAMVPVKVGMNADGSPIEVMHMLSVLASKNGETWTMLIVDPNKQACQYGHGYGWEALKAEYGVAG